MEIIRKYLIEERKMSVVVAERTLEKLARHPDISDELKSWIANRTYETNTPVSVEGYTGADIARLAPFMDGVGVFTFLVSLREQPEKAKEQITMGFPRK
ncbi:MAG: hypothetical protein ACLUIC_05445 [Oscillospiraceae bacterium]